MDNNRRLDNDNTAGDLYSSAVTTTDRLVESAGERTADITISSDVHASVGTLLERIRNRSSQIIVTTLYVALFVLAGIAVATAADNFIHYRYTLTLMPWTLFGTLVVAPLVLWLYSTSVQWFAYYNRKRRFFNVSLLITVFTISTLYLSIISRLVYSLVAFIPIKGSMVMNEGTVVVSGWVLTGILYVLPMYKIVSSVLKASYEDLFMDWFKSVDFEKIFPKRDKNEKYAYNLNIIHDMTTGKEFIISESDRRLHTLGLGSTGTGKTSAVETVSFESDIRKKAINTDIQKKFMHRLCEEKLVELTKPFEDIDFNIDNFRVKRNVPVEKAKKIEEEIKNMKFTAKNAGLTVFCPNTEYCDELYALCEAKGIRANRIDPVKNDNGTWKKGFIGFNPLYVYHDPNEEDALYFDRVFDVAKAAADVNQAVFDLQGTQDAYFSGLNRNIYVAAAIACIIGMPLMHPGVYAKPDDVQDVLNDFTKVKEYRNAIVNHYGERNEMGAVISSVGSAKVVKNLQFVVDRIDKDMLGSNSQKMTEQAVGLRNIVDETLMVPAVRQILCSDRTLDFNRALAEGQVTLINFNLQMGDAAATNFGLFILLNFINAALRRPGKLETRIPHFLAVDECARLFHPKLEITLALFRQYNIACTYFVQNLGQFDKNRTTQYLKGVFASNCAHQIFYGRAGVEEMEYIENIAGQRRVRTESVGVRESSLADTNSAKNYSTQYKVEMQNNVEATDARYRNFLECTVLSVRKSSALPPFIGRTNFLPKFKRKPQKRLHYDDWMNYYFAPTSNETPVVFKHTSETKIETDKREEKKENTTSATSTTTIGDAPASKKRLIMGGFDDEPVTPTETDTKTECVATEERDEVESETDNATSEDIFDAKYGGVE